MPLQVPLQDLRRHNAPLQDALHAASQRVLASGWYILGREVSQFEEEFSRFLGARHCVSNGNGTDSLELALRACGVSADDEVILAANAGLYSTVATLAVHALPRYVEIAPDRLSLDPAAVAAAITPRTRAVIITHLYGCAGYIREIASLCRRHHLRLIEDCAECHGARVEGRRLGTWGDVGCFSFYPTKNLGALGDGGACTTDDDELAGRLRKLRQYGWETRYRTTLAGGRNSRLDELQAAFLRAKLPLVDGWNLRRREIAARYNRAFAPLGWALPPIEGEAYVGHLYVARVPHRETLRAHLTQQGVATDIHFPTPDYLQPGLQSSFDRAWSLPITEQACGSVLTLPCFPELSEDELDHVIKAVLSAPR